MWDRPTPQLLCILSIIQGRESLLLLFWQVIPVTFSTTRYHFHNFKMIINVLIIISTQSIIHHTPWSTMCRAEDFLHSCSLGGLQLLSSLSWKPLPFGKGALAIYPRLNLRSILEFMCSLNLQWLCYYSPTFLFTNFSILQEQHPVYQ